VQCCLTAAERERKMRRRDLETEKEYDTHTQTTQGDEARKEERTERTRFRVTCNTGAPDPPTTRQMTEQLR
jgi:chitodextrinase